MAKKATQQKRQAPDEETLLKAKSDALRLLSFGPRSEQELKNRLKLKRYSGEVVETTVTALVRQGLLDDEQYAAALADTKLYAQPGGLRRLEYELKRKHVSPAVIEKTLAKLSGFDERQAAYDLVKARFSKMTGVSPGKKKMRIHGYLQRRGFKPEVIFSVLRDLFKDLDMSGE